MSYVDNDNKENKEKKNNDKSKLGEFMQTVFASETIEETPEEIIEKDTDNERRELFKKTYNALLAMYPEDKKKKKKKQKKEKEEQLQQARINSRAREEEKEKNNEERER